MMKRTDRLERLAPILVCPDCGSGLLFAVERATCEGCAADYPIKNGKIYFIPVPKSEDEFDSVKYLLKKRLGKYYYKIGLTVIAPTFPFNYGGKIRKYCDPARQIVVDIGCGNHRVDEDTVGLDIFDYSAVDVVCDLCKLPFKPGSVDAFVSRSVLEHVPDLPKVAAQLDRCTKVGGHGMHLIPFLFPFHASPYDFQRLTHKGQQGLFEGWTVVEQTNPTGPVTLGLVCLIEFLSILLSFGHEKVKAFVYLLFCGLLFPLKFLDLPFVHRKAFLTLAPTIFTVVRKKSHE